MTNKLKVEINKTNSVTLKIKDVSSYGTVRGTKQVTFSRYEFERALREADITVPWSAVTK